MQVQKSNKRISKARPVRQAPVLQNKGKRQNGSKQGYVDAGSTGGIRFHLLAKELQTKSLLEVSLKIGGPEYIDQGLLDAIDTEEKQLQCIHDLYLIVKAQPKYKKLKEPVFTADTDPVDVIAWLLRKLSPLAKGESWQVDTYQDGKQTRFRFVIYKHFSSYHIKRRQEFISVDFLPFLKNRDEPLHDLIIDTLALVSKVNKIPLWDEDGDFSEAMNNLLQQGKSDIYELERQKQSYATGPAAEYLKLFKQRRKVVTYNSIYQQMAKYDDCSDRKRGFFWTLKRGLTMVSWGNNLQEFTYIPDYIKTPVLTPERLYKIVWTVHDSDVVYLRAKSKLQKDEDKNGVHTPMIFTIAKPGQAVKPLPVMNDYPPLLYDFMATCVNHTRWTYRDYYYKKMFEEKLSPAEQLLERIEKAEIIKRERI